MTDVIKICKKHGETRFTGIKYPECALCRIKSREKRRARILEWQRNHRARNKEKYLAYKRKHYEKHRDKINEYRRNYYDKNKKHIQEIYLKNQIYKIFSSPNLTNEEINELVELKLAHLKLKRKIKEITHGNK